MERIPSRYIKLMQTYPWPGNIREIQNVLRRAMILADGNVLEMDEGWLHAPERGSGASRDSAEGSEAHLKSLSEMEKAHILNVLRHTGGNYGEACRILGVSRPTLRKKIHDYELKEFLEA